MPVPTRARSKSRMPPGGDDTRGKSKHKSHRFVRARTIDLRHGRSHGPQIRGNLSPVMDDVEQKSPGVLITDFVHDGLTAKQERDRLFPPSVVDRLKPLRKTLAMPI